MSGDGTMLVQEEVADHLIALRVACDPESPFFGRVGLDDLLALPARQQWQIWNAMDDTLRANVEAFRSRVEG